MIVWPMFGAALLAVLASAQTADDPDSSGAALLLLPRSGVPVSFEQIEDRSPRQDGASRVEVKRSKCYRDSSGRLRIGDSSYTVLIDPIAGSRILLSKQVAYRTPWPKSGEAKLAFLGIGDSTASSHNWTARTENVGTRAIEGIEFRGTRVIQTAEGEPTLTKTVEEWYSDELKLIAFAVTSTADETYSVRIQNLHREEPDPALFTIPPDYQVLDLKLPSP